MTVFLAIVWQALIAHGVNIEAQDIRRWTSLMLASNEGHLPTVEVESHLESTILTFIPKITALSSKQRLQVFNIVHQCLAFVWQVLIAQGCNIEAQDRFHCTSLMLASQNGHLHVVKVKSHL